MLQRLDSLERHSGTKCSEAIEHKVPEIIAVNDLLCWKTISKWRLNNFYNNVFHYCR